MEENNRYSKGLRDGIFFVLFVCAAIGITFFLMKEGYSRLNPQPNHTADTYGEAADEKIGLLQDYIDHFYVGDVKDEQVVEGIYDGMINSLGDRYSAYYTEEEYKQLKESMTGSYCGIGVSVMQNTSTGDVMIVKVFHDSPAEKAGIQVGDMLYAVNGDQVAGKDLSSAVAEVKGEKGTEVGITVVREGKQMEYTVKRGEVKMDTVTCCMLEEGIGYLYISEFDEVTTKQTEDAINELLKQGMTSIVVDLRDNPGGRLDAVTKIMDMFLPKDKLLLYMKAKSGERTDYYSENTGMIPDMPMTILVNGNSASAAELFCGAMQSYKRATLVGTNTFGKGVVQSVFDLGDGTALKLTTAKYYLPNDENVNEVGVHPDVVVQLPEGVKSCWELSEKEDVQLQKAIEILKQ